METPVDGRPRSAALDGLRALAVSAVVLFHAGAGWLPGGFLGVDLFFVLSGYLITGLLLEERLRTGRVDLPAFWARRARRLLPALLVVVLVVVGTAAARGASVNRLRGDALATLGWASNWRFAAADDGYFAQLADPSALQHTWSLAIEEQFYLVWPLLLLLLLLRWRRTTWTRGVAALAGAGALASAAACAWAATHGAGVGALYYRTDTRAQALLTGALLAVLLPLHAERSGTVGRSARIGHWIGPLALVAVAVLWVSARGDASWLYTAGLPAAALGSAALIAAVVAAPAGGLARLLGSWPLRSLGRISYGVYLWHWPVDLALNAERTGSRGPALLGLRIGATLALATLSWFVIEQPVRRAVRLPRVVLPSAIAAAAATAGLVVLATLPPVVGQPLPVSAALPAATAATQARPEPQPTAARPRPGPRARPTTPAPVAPLPLLRVTVLGDSVADSIGAVLAGADAPLRARVSNRGIVGCGIATTPRYRLRGEVHELADACRDWERSWAAAIARDRPQVALVVVGRHEVWDGELAGRWSSVGRAEFDAYLADRLDRAIDLAAASGARVALATSPYFHGREAPDGSRYPENDPRRVDRFNALLRTAVARHPSSAFVVELGQRSCPGGRYASTVDGVRLRSDGVHFSPAGVRWLAPWLVARLREAA